MNWLEDLADKALCDEYLDYLVSKSEQIYASTFLKYEKSVALSEKEYNDILRFSDILCRSNKAEGRNKAYKIISLLYDNYSNDAFFKSCAEAVLTKLGNFPTLHLAVSEDECCNNIELYFEKAIKETYQEAPFNGMVFTDAQYKLFEALKDSNHYSFSGPTSFGKSFIIEAYIKYIVDERNAVDNIVILVPTRALINQVSKKFKTIIHNTKYRILSHPVVPEIFRSKDYKYIFVFTPERWISYASKSDNPIVSYMFVDEAQKIVSKNDTRSPLYYHAILLAQRKSVKLYFASPNIPNAEVFLELFEKSTDASMIIQDSPVAQNRFYLDYIDKKVVFFLDNGEELILSNEILNISDTRSKLLLRLGYGCKNIVYCNTVDDTVEYALSFSEKLPLKNDPRIQPVIDLIKSHVHKDYYLIDCLRKGVAFHFGRIPQRIREKVESLFLDKAIDYIFCTSTLLEGVNLPAKNIFILNNAIGNRKFSDIDFWNLAGRAGRLSKELSGNIICVRYIDKRNRWDNPKNDLQVVKSKTIAKIEPTIIKGEQKFYTNIGNSLQGERFTRKNVTRNEKDVLDHYANILLIHQVNKKASVLLENFIENQTSSINILEKAEKSNFIPARILDQCSSIKAIYQNRIWNEISEPPAFPCDVSVSSCELMLYKFYKYYNWAEEESGGANPLVHDEKRLKYYARLMYSWMKGTPLNFLINNLLKYFDEKGQLWTTSRGYFDFDIKDRRHINIVINNLIADIDTALRFRLKNYFMNYYLICEEKFGEQKSGSNWAEFLEYGTMNKIVIELQNIGIPRHIALVIIEYYSECLTYADEKLVRFDEELLRKSINIEVHSSEYEELCELFEWSE